MHPVFTFLRGGLIVLITMTSFSVYAGRQDNKAAKKVYQRAKKASIAQKWNQAIDEFQSLIDKYPESRYTDDAQFWIGYCLEKRSDTKMQAFLTYDELIQNYPESPWCDDAIVHQILLSELFVQQGNPQFLDFLLEKLDDSDEPVRQQAALALGRLGDDRSKAPLKSMTDDETIGTIAQSVLDQMGKPQRLASIRPKAMDESPYLQFDVETKDKLEKARRVARSNGIQFSFTKRYKQYRSMLKKGNRWTQNELIDFAMWQILQPDEYEEFDALENYDRSEWLRKYWALRDPTPTTPENEAYDEFERRIEFSRNNFSEFWNFKHLAFLRDQHMREDWPHAPWDARGELYIKYGEPDFRSVAKDHQEEWIYERYNVDFMIKKFMTNIYGEAIEAGRRSKIIHENNMAYVDADFIFNQDFRHEHNYASEQLNKLKVSVDNEPVDAEFNVFFEYNAPIKEVDIQPAADGFSIKYLRRLVVYDEDMREVYRHEAVHEKVEATEKALKKKKRVEENIPIKLVPGDYLAALRIEDMQSNKLGIILQYFTVEND